MLYEFQCPDGELILLPYSPDDAPDIGEVVVTSEGVRARRIPSTPEIKGAHEGSTAWPRFESHQLPRNWKHHKGEFSPEGKPRFNSKQEIKEACARASHLEGQEVRHGEL